MIRRTGSRLAPTVYSFGFALPRPLRAEIWMSPLICRCATAMPNKMEPDAL